MTEPQIITLQEWYDNPAAASKAVSDGAQMSIESMLTVGMLVYLAVNKVFKWAPVQGDGVLEVAGNLLKLGYKKIFKKDPPDV